MFASTSERGCALLTRTSPAPRRALAIDVAADSTPALVAFRAVAEGLVHVHGNVECARVGNDPEGVHQMRVGVRRLRVAGSIARAFPGNLQAELKWLCRVLGETRDLDVFATQTWPAVREAFGAPAAETTAFERAIARHRTASHQRLRHALDGRRFRLLMLALGWAVSLQGDDLSKPAAHLTTCSPRRLLARRAKRTLARGDAVAPLTEHQRHRLRIDLRKLRYLAEFFSSLYPSQKTKRYLRRIATVQNELGSLNDLAVAGRLVRSVASTGTARRRKVVTGMWRRHAAGIKPILERRLDAAWKEYAAATPFWQ